MGLQKRPDTDTGADTEAEVDKVQEKAAPATNPAPTVAKADAPKKDNGRTLNLLAVKRPISDPMTGVEYDLNAPRPGVVKEGNWLHAQMMVGILKEWTPPDTPEIEA
jgi:hypothetical protein